MASIKVIRSGEVRRAKLYYLRDRKGKSARIAEKIKKKIGVDVSTKTQESEEVVLARKVEEIRSDDTKKEKKEDKKNVVTEKEVIKKDLKKEEKK